MVKSVVKEQCLRGYNLYLLSRFISIPTDEVQVQEIMDGFEGKAGFPQVIGAIDGCHIPIICPKDVLEDYNNRKGFYSFILPRFVDIVAHVFVISTFLGQDVYMTREF